MSTCPVCQRTFPTERGVLTHLGKGHRNPPTGDCEVPGCPTPARIVRGAPRRRCAKHEKQRESAVAKAKGNTCRIDGCGRPVSQSRSLCPGHLSRLSARGDLEVDVPIRVKGTTPKVWASDACDVQGCTRPRSQDGKSQHCYAHAKRLRLHGHMFEDIPIPAPHGALQRAAATAVNERAELVSAKC